MAVDLENVDWEFEDKQEEIRKKQAEKVEAREN